MAEAVTALRQAGANVEEGWPPGVVPTEQYDTYLYLLNSVFAFRLRDDRIEQVRGQSRRSRRNISG